MAFGRCALVFILILLASESRGARLAVRLGAKPAQALAPRAALRLSGPAEPAGEDRVLPVEGSRERLNARLAMLGSAVCYGAYAPAIKEVYVLPGPPSASALSCARGLLIALPLVPKLWERDEGGQLLLNERCLRTAAELAAYSFALTLLLNVGLAQGGSATKAAFLLQAAVIFTPCLSWAAREKVEGKTWIGALMALLGVALIALDEGEVASTEGLSALFHFETPDLLFLGTAFAWALTIFRLGWFARSTELAEKVLNIQAAKNVILAFAFSAWLAFDLLATGTGLSAQWPGVGNPLVWVFVVASALFGGLFGDLLQAIGGRAMPAAEANVILTSEPLWAAALTALFLHERLGVGVYAGGALLIGAGVVATVGLPSVGGLTGDRERPPLKPGGGSGGGDGGASSKFAPGHSSRRTAPGARDSNVGKGEARLSRRPMSPSRNGDCDTS